MLNQRLEKTMKLLGLESLPSGSPRQVDILVNWTEKAIQQYGEDWVKEHRQLLLDQWEWCLEMGV